MTGIIIPLAIAAVGGTYIPDENGQAKKLANDLLRLL
jgi:hypothetical protein